jgi:6 kDa early secretory antigenic target
MSLVYNFAGIEGGAGEIQAYVGATNGLLDEGKASLAALADVWGGSGSQAYQEVQRKWDAASMELNAALQNLGHTIGEAGQNMGQTEAGVTSSFL